MASTNFQDFNQNTPVVAAWLNDVNKGVYSPGGVAKVASLTPAAWVRFAVNSGVVTIQQSVNITSVVRTGPGIFTITYSQALTNTTNCYQITQNVAGFAFAGAETGTSVVVNTTSTSNAATDPGTCSVVIWGAN